MPDRHCQFPRHARSGRRGRGAAQHWARGAGSLAPEPEVTGS